MMYVDPSEVLSKTYPFYTLLRCDDTPLISYAYAIKLRLFSALRIIHKLRIAWKSTPYKQAKYSIVTFKWDVLAKF